MTDTTIDVVEMRALCDAADIRRMLDAWEAGLGERSDPDAAKIRALVRTCRVLMEVTAKILAEDLADRAIVARALASASGRVPS